MSSSESMSSMSSSLSDQWVPLTDFEDDYEIEIEAPHRIRRKRDGLMLKLTLNKTLGYVIVSLNGEQYYYHRILAKHFIPNPENLQEVDHIDRDKKNNALENLRWVTRTENNSNRTVKKYGKREVLDHAPNDITEIRTFNDVEYAENKYFFCFDRTFNDVEYAENKYFFCFENDRVVMRVNDHKWQWVAQTPHNGYLRINMCDINDRYHQIYMHKLINHFRNEPAADENVDE